MPYYPINLDLRGRECVVVGGGAVAERKVEGLLECGARVTVVSPELTPELLSLVEAGGIGWVNREYSPGALAGAFLVIAATDDRNVNQAVSDEAMSGGILVNVVDDPELCSFIVPATVKRGDLMVSISTSGSSPALARRIRGMVESCIGPEYGDLAWLLGELRDEVKSSHPAASDRLAAFDRIIDDAEILRLLAAGEKEAAIGKARQCIL